jgi:hypothetical protein
VSRTLEQFLDATMTQVLEHQYSLNPQQRLAYNLFHTAYFEDNAETAYILLITAIEALLPSEEAWPTPVLTVISALKAKLNEMTPGCGGWSPLGGHREAGGSSAGCRKTSRAHSWPRSWRGTGGASADIAHAQIRPTASCRPWRISCPP